MIYGGLFDLNSKIERRDELDKIINAPNFWNSNNKDNYLKEYNSLVNLIDDVVNIKNKIDSNIELLNSDVDDELLMIIDEEYNEIFNNVNRLRIDT